MSRRFIAPLVLLCAVCLASCSPTVRMTTPQDTVVPSSSLYSRHLTVRMTTPQDTVVRLYRDFAAEAVLEDPVLPGLWNEPLQVWQIYFSKRIVNLYAGALKCAEKFGGICTTEMSPIWWTMDPGGVTVSIQPASMKSTVTATIHFPKDTAQLEYRLTHEEDGWKIDDIVYPDGETLQGWFADVAQ